MDIWGLWELVGGRHALLVWEKLKLPTEIILNKSGARVNTDWAPRLPWGICLGVENVSAGVSCPWTCVVLASWWMGPVGPPHPPRSQVCSACLPAMGLQGLDRHCSLSTLPTKAEP